MDTRPVNPLDKLTEARAPAHVIGVVGGAVAGSEAAALCAKRGAIAVVFEQGARPYGKIEDGLPRWHVKLREQEYARIDENLTTDGVIFVPKTRVGESVALTSLLGDLGMSAVLLASGAWRDRPLPIEGAERFVDKGLVYQNPFVYWFNHYVEPGYDGPRYEVHDGTIVVGGGLASIDVVKIVNLELYRRALAARGIEIDIVDLEQRGIPKVLEAHGLSVDALGVRGVTLYYRRSKEDMPLASMDDPTPEQQAKLRVARGKVMDRVMRKYLVRLVECAAPVEVIAEGDRLAGLRFERTEVIDGRVRRVAGSTFEVRAPMVISSIGSVPAPMTGVPMRGELYQFADWHTGAVEGLPGTYGLGNVLTGKGNIKDSRKNAVDVADQVLSRYLGVGEAVSERPAALVPPVVRDAVDEAMRRGPVAPQAQRRLGEAVRALWQQAGYTGDYAAWIAAAR